MLSPRNELIATLLNVIGNKMNGIGVHPKFQFVGLVDVKNFIAKTLFGGPKVAKQLFASEKVLRSTELKRPTYFFKRPV